MQNRSIILVQKSFYSFLLTLQSYLNCGNIAYIYDYLEKYIDNSQLTERYCLCRKYCVLSKITINNNIVRRHTKTNMDLCATPNMPINTDIKTKLPRILWNGCSLKNTYESTILVFCKIRKHTKRQIDALHKCLHCKTFIIFSFHEDELHVVIEYSRTSNLTLKQTLVFNNILLYYSTDGSQT